MTSHAKHAGARPVPSTEELARLGQGTRRVVLGGESFARFDDCALCLRPAVAPVCCPRGHVFCRECICRSLLHQRRAIAAKQAAYRRLCAARACEDATGRRAAQQELVDALRRIDAGIAADALEAASSSSKKARTTTTAADTAATATTRTTRTRTTAVSATGACFWLPSQTPAARATVADVTGVASGAAVEALQPLCPAAKADGPDAHALRLKQLIPLVFTDAPDSHTAAAAAAATADAEEEQGTPDDGAPPQEQGNERRHQCPVCLRALTNNRQCALPRPCGHVACLECIRTLLVAEPSHDKDRDRDKDKDKDKAPQRVGKCFVCGTAFREADIVPLCAGATGYAGHGDQLVVETYRPSLPMP